MGTPGSRRRLRFCILHSALCIYTVPRQHRHDGWRVPLRQPTPLRVLVYHEHIPVAIRAPEQYRRVVRETIAH